ncbi:hypothetical protein JCM3770_001710 [Rhodotorula araucariae]
MSSGPSPSWTPRTTPGTERRYASTTAPSSSRKRLTRGIKAVLLLALVAVLLIAVLPPAVVSIRNKHEVAEDRSLGYTTLVDGVTTFVQTRTASVVTRNSYSTLANGEVSTVLQAVTLPIVTVSATSAGEVQQGFETVTIDGEEVIVATRTQYVEGGNAFVIRTATGAALAVATVYETVYDDVTLLHHDGGHHNFRNDRVDQHYDDTAFNYTVPLDQLDCRLLNEFVVNDNDKFRLDVGGQQHIAAS